MSNVVRRHPLTVFFTVAIGLTWVVQLAFLAQGWELTPALLIELAILLGSATAITGITSGRSGVRRLFASLVRWRIGVVRLIVVLAAMPLLTVGVGAVTGTLHAPEAGWGAEIANYLFLAVVFGALLGNAWEETAWAGFAQTRLMQRHGLMRGSLLCAVPFFLIHLPLAFAEKGLGATPWTEAALT